MLRYTKLFYATLKKKGREKAKKKKKKKRYRVYRHEAGLIRKLELGDLGEGRLVIHVVLKRIDR